MSLILTKRSTKGEPLTAEDFDGNMEAIESEFASLETTDLESRVAQNETDIGTLQLDVDQAETDIISVTTDLTTHTDTVSGNPHGVTKTDVSLGNVTNDAQLKREANDWDAFSAKTMPIGADRILIEDSEAVVPYTKKKVELSKLALYLEFRSTDPDDPAHGESVMWISDGTASGSAGDVLIKINVSGVIKTFVLISFTSGQDYEI